MMKTKYIILLFTLMSCFLLFGCNSQKADPSSTPFESKTEGAIITASTEAITTPVPTLSELPTPVPTATTVPTDTEAPTSVPTATPIDTPTPKPDHLFSYYSWLIWRKDNPEEYSKWQDLPMPDASDYNYLSRIPESTWRDADNYLRFRFWIDLLDDVFIYNLVNVFPEEYQSSERLSVALINDPLSLPIFYIDLVRFHIPKRELLEWEKWIRMYSNKAVFSIEEIDLLYSDDLESIRQHFKLPRYVFGYDDLIFRDDEIRFYISPFDIGRMFTPDSYKVFIDDFDKKMLSYGLDKPVEARLDQIDPWEEYKRIKQRDAGELTIEAAEEMIGEFMDFYKNLRYSPDEIAGESLKDNSKALSDAWYSDKCILSDIYYISRVQFSIFSFDMTAYYNFTTFSGQIVDCMDHNYPYFRWVVSMDPKFYQGEIELFDDDYTLADHINIVYTDNEDAYVELTARKRDGSGEAVYTVNFQKSYERWRITSGTMLDLIAPVE